MKIPRDVNGTMLIKRLEKFGYQVTRQTGSHIRLTSLDNGVHHLTIPNHNPIKIGTLSSILQDVASHNGISKQEIIDQLFG
jgi:predicted RNA binding protein YcfA (HicA-like mRNA interferase family)